jgi:hypothetical protein
MAKGRDKAKPQEKKKPKTSLKEKRKLKKDKGSFLIRLNSIDYSKI